MQLAKIGDPVANPDTGTLGDLDRNGHNARSRLSGCAGFEYDGLRICKCFFAIIPMCKEPLSQKRHQRGISRIGAVDDFFEFR